MVSRVYKVRNPRNIQGGLNRIPLISTGDLVWYDGDQIMVPDEIPQSAADSLVIEGCLEEVV